MPRFEPVVLERKPDWVVVYGDVNSTAAAALVCAKLLIKVAHVEADLRSFDGTMPHDINRVITDQLSDLLFTPLRDGNENLAREGIAAEKIHLVGNVMIDTLTQRLPSAVANPGTSRVPCPGYPASSFECRMIQILCDEFSNLYWQSAMI
jgi:UDP-N-acetylglucosamine 2-epimerase (non-hydrolysing)